MQSAPERSDSLIHEASGPAVSARQGIVRLIGPVVLLAVFFLSLPGDLGAIPIPEFGSGGTGSSTEDSRGGGTDPVTGHIGGKTERDKKGAGRR